MKTVTRLQMSVNAKGDVGRGAMKLTIKEIADMAGVSVTTVSQILNNKGVVSVKNPQQGVGGSR